MKLTILGSGTHFPSLNRNAAGYLLEYNKKFTLFDIGPGIIKQLLKKRVDYTKIHKIFITHTHNDHISDLYPYLSTLKNQTLLGVLKNYKLNLYGPNQVKEFYQKMLKYFMKRKKLPFPIKIKVLKNDRIRIGKITVQSVSVNHFKKQALSYKVSVGKKSFVYSGDLDWSDSIIGLSKGVDVLIIECGFPNQMKIKGHLTAGECGQIARQAKVKKLVLTHFYPMAEKYDLKKQAKKYYKGPIILAKDLMTIII